MSKEKGTGTAVNLKYIGIGLIWVAVAVTVIGVAAFTGNTEAVGMATAYGFVFAFLATAILG